LKKTIILTDEDVKYDKRVQNQYLNFKNNYVDIIKCKTEKKFKKIDFSFLKVLNKKNIKRFRVLKDKYNIDIKSLFSGLRNILFKNTNAKILADMLYKKKFDFLYANDLFCGIVGMYLKNKKKDFYFIYDSHEVQFNRNRKKNGLFRILYEMYLEERIVKIADEVRVVNKPIRDLYLEIFDISKDKIKVVNNNHFKCYCGYYKNNFKYGDIGILYVGGGIKGRLLEVLAKEANKLNIPVYSFFLNEVPKVAKEYNWYVGDKNYIHEVLDLIKEKTLIMWCVNDVSCLSYKLALPNKFFQAVALGMPVIVYKDTYLAEIVRKYKIGYVFEDNLKDIIDKINDKEEFFKVVDNMENFQKLIYKEKLIL